VTTVIALGGNALLRRGEEQTIAVQRRNVRAAVEAIAPLAGVGGLIVTHGNGPQVGWLAAERHDASGGAPPLDVLDAETEGMIGYLIMQELLNALPAGGHCVTLLTQTEVAPDDPAFERPDKPIGPVYTRDRAEELARSKGWSVAAAGGGWRRVVASPRPVGIVELPVIARLVAAGVAVVCAGGGGIPVVRGPDGRIGGVEAVVDKDRASTLIGCGVGADRLVILTDVDAIYEGWGGARPRAISRISPEALRAYEFARGSMAPKAQAAAEFSARTGGTAHIGALGAAADVIAGRAGTTVVRDAGATVYCDGG
jgi:carbamate kinase